MDKLGACRSKVNVHMDHLTVLGRDKRLARVLTLVTPYKPTPQRDVYLRLLRAIAGQQLSVKAASTIWGRFLNLFPEQYPEASLLRKMHAHRLRSAGLSYPKARYMKNIAAFSMENDLSVEYLQTLSDDEVILYLEKIKGVGQWTIEMLLMFTLERPDVFPVDDRGILNAMKKLYRLKEEGKTLRLKCLRLAERWRPYRSYACFYLWPYKDAPQ